MSSESPKWIALVLSIIAIVSSTLSWLEARQNRIINQEVNRPFLAVAGSQTATSLFKNQSSQTAFKINLKNDGKIQALVTKITVRLSQGATTVDSVEGCKIESHDTKPTPQRLNILPGTERAFEFNALFTSLCQHSDLDVELVIEVNYQEPSLGTEYSQTFTETFEMFTKDG